MPLGEEGDWDHNECGWEWVGVDECDDLDGFTQAHFVGNEASVVGRGSGNLGSLMGRPPHTRCF